MRPPRARPTVGLILAVAATGTLACGELPTQAADPPASDIAFALSDGSVRGFTDALNDVRLRILPGLAPNDAGLAPTLAELTEAIAARDQAALRRALARADAALASLERTDAAVEANAADIDAVRLILDQARPLVGRDDHQ